MTNFSFLRDWYGQLNDIKKDLEDNGCEVLEINNEYVDFYDKDENEYIIRFSGTSKTITLSKPEKIEESLIPIEEDINEKYDVFCVDCDTITRQTYKGKYANEDMFICSDCGCENSEKNYFNKNLESITIKKEGTKLKRISSYKEFDNDHVIHNDFKEMSDGEPIIRIFTPDEDRPEVGYEDWEFDYAPENRDKALKQAFSWVDNYNLDESSTLSENKYNVKFCKQAEIDKEKLLELFDATDIKYTGEDKEEDGIRYIANIANYDNKYDDVFNTIIKDYDPNVFEYNKDTDYGFISINNDEKDFITIEIWCAIENCEEQLEEDLIPIEEYIEDEEDNRCYSDAIVDNAVRKITQLAPHGFSNYKTIDDLYKVAKEYCTATCYTSKDIEKVVKELAKFYHLDESSMFVKENQNIDKEQFDEFTSIQEIIQSFLNGDNNDLGYVIEKMDDIVTKYKRIFNGN